MFFELFQTLGSAHALFHYLAENDIRLPFRDQPRDPGGSIAWRLPAKSQVYGMLLNPLYAGAYGYGRRRRYGRKNAEKTGTKHLPKEQ